MARMAKKPILIDAGVTATLTGDGKMQITGPKGQLEIVVPQTVKVNLHDNMIEVSTLGEEETNLQGLVSSLIKNALVGVTKEWSKSLELIGVGFRAQTTGAELILNVGFSHPVKITAPNGITFTVSENLITVSGADKYAVGEVAARVKRVKPAEPYKGKGIKYQGEVIRRKLGKAAKTVGAAAGAK